TVLACDPAGTFVIRREAGGCPLRAMADHFGKYPAIRIPHDGPPFGGGWIGFVSYEAGLATERIRPTTRCDVDVPLVRFGLYDAAAVYDHLVGQWWLAAVEWPRSFASRRPSVASRLRMLRQRLEDVGDPGPCESFGGDEDAAMTANLSRSEYKARVDCAKRYIEAGDIYQVNLTTRFSTRTSLSPVELYRRLRRTSPSSHAAFLGWQKTAVISASPELFLDLRAGHVVTRPIKGTRPRGVDADEDDVLRRELVESEKDRAELTMIVDLLRNDLGRVCSFGSVRVLEGGEIETHPTVFHRVATVEGQLAGGRSWSDLLPAAFPGGSITGAPKIRAMQIIDELEPTHRGVYCGSIGWIGLDGSMSLNIAIRTMVQIEDMVHAYAGGAVVAESDAEKEYEEVLAKAAGMFRAIQGGAWVESVPVSEVTAS
ncbi:MAG: aminodeoxychorismate synthase component I, partial [Phycisphaerae bacterium]